MRRDVFNVSGANQRKVPETCCEPKTWVSTRRLLLWVLLMAAQISACLAAQPQEEETPSYNFRSYQTDSGLPESTVNAMAQTPDGYIWCATFNGLARFDGVRFITFDPSNTPELPTDRVTRLGITRLGALVIVTEFGDVVVSRDGRFSRCGSGKSHRYEAIVEDGAGRLWTSSLNRSDGVCWSPLGHDGKGAMPEPIATVIPLIYTNIGPWILDGKTMIVSDLQTLRKATSSGTWEDLIIQVRGERATGLLYPGRNRPWLVTSNHFFAFDGHSVRRVVNRPAGRLFTRLLEDAAGNVWLLDYHGRIYRAGAHDDTFAEVDTLPGRDSTWIPCGFVDRENDLWVAMASRGLLEVQPAAMHCLRPQDGLLNDIVRTVSHDGEGNLWVCTAHGINLISNKGITAPLVNNFAWSTAPSSDGGVWLATYASGLYHCLPGCDFRPVQGIPYENWEPPDFTFLHTDHRGDLWFGNNQGLFHFDGTNATRMALPVNGPVDVRVFAEGTDGTLFAGSNGQGLFVRKQGQWLRFGREEGLESEQVYSLHLGPQGLLWIGTSGAGLARFNGQKFFFFKGWANELPRTVTGIEDDALGYLWLGSTRGIFRAKLNDLNAAAEDRAESISITEFGRKAGLQSAESVAGVGPSVAKGRDGRIWFATTGGVVCFDPKRIPENKLPPPVVIESVASGSCRIDLTAQTESVPAHNRLLWLSDSPDRVMARAGTDPIEFDFTGLSFVAPENVRFRYRLEGLDQEWTMTQERKAVYQRLPPARYLFHVLACNNNGIWNETGAELAIVQLPFYWQTAWFKVALAAAAGLLGYLAYRYRVSQLARVGRLRARIAADLHDEVGSNMGAVVLNSDLLTMSPNLSGPEREQIADIHRLARDTAHAIREIGWFINPDFDSVDEMILRMKETAGRLMGTFQINFSAPEAPPKLRLGLEFRRHVMGIYKEALNNAVRHSGGRRIDIDVDLNSGRMELQIRDDGRGFTAGQESAGQGLRNLRQRAKALGGQLTIDTAPAAGSTVRLSVPIR